MLIYLAKVLSFILPILISVAFLTLVERKVLAAMQRRVGPNVVGFLGLLQPIADAAKLLLKESVLPSPANRWLFLFAPMITFILALLGWIVIPTFDVLADINLGLSYIFAISSLRRLWYYYSQAGLVIQDMVFLVLSVLQLKWFHMKFQLVLFLLIYFLLLGP